MPWQPATVIPPDVEAVLCGAYGVLLAAHGHPSTFVSRVVPEPRAGVTINRDGGSLTGDLRDIARVRFRTWASTYQAANELARTIIGVTPLLVTNGVALRTEVLSGPFEVADTSGTPCVYVLQEIHFRSTPLP